MKWFRILAVTLSLVVLAVLLVWWIEPWAMFPDDTLEAVIREALGKPPGEEITVEELVTITELRSGNTFQRVGDLKGIEHLVNLTSLSIRVEHAYGISRLASLTNLTQLYITGSVPSYNLLQRERYQTGDISPLANLTSLTELHLAGTQIRDLSPLANLTNLTELDLRDNQIRDLSPLTNLTNLTELNLRDNQISNISPLANLTNLTELNLYRNNSSDISALAGLTNLRSLDLYRNNSSDISPLAGLTNLLWLYLGLNNISDISPVASLTNLEYLSLYANNISDISPLVENSGLSAGDTVDLRGNPLSTASVYVYIPQLKARGVNVIY